MAGRVMKPTMGSIFCTECGNKCQPEWKFCSRCGKKVEITPRSTLETCEALGTSRSTNRLLESQSQRLAAMINLPPATTTSFTSTLGAKPRLFSPGTRDFLDSVVLYMSQSGASSEDVYASFADSDRNIIGPLEFKHLLERFSPLLSADENYELVDNLIEELGDNQGNISARDFSFLLESYTRSAEEEGGGGKWKGPGGLVVRRRTTDQSDWVGFHSDSSNGNTSSHDSGRESKILIHQESEKVSTTASNRTSHRNISNEMTPWRKHSWEQLWQSQPDGTSRLQVPGQAETAAATTSATQGDSSFFLVGDGKNLRVHVQEELPCSLNTLYNEIYGDASPFITNYFGNDFKVEVTKWQSEPHGEASRRRVQLTTSKRPWGELKTTEEQRIEWKIIGRAFRVDTRTSTPRLPFGENWRCERKVAYVATSEDAPTCVITISANIVLLKDFAKSTAMLQVLESSIPEECRNYFAAIRRALRHCTE